jgi:hypothetical protein
LWQKCSIKLLSVERNRVKKASKRAMRAFISCCKSGQS